MLQVKELNDLLEEYLIRIHLIMDRFETLFGRRNPAGLWRKGLIPRIGFLRDNHKDEFSFHGAGCTVEFETGELVSFDFMEDDTISFDLFKFELFVLSKKYNEKEVSELFKRITLIRNGSTWMLIEKS